MGPSLPLFLYFHIFSTVDSKEMFCIKYADDQIKTADIYFRK